MHGGRKPYAFQLNIRGHSKFPRECLRGCFPLFLQTKKKRKPLEWFCLQSFCNARIFECILYPLRISKPRFFGAWGQFELSYIVRRRTEDIKHSFYSSCPLFDGSKTPYRLRLLKPKVEEHKEKTRYAYPIEPKGTEGLLPQRSEQELDAHECHEEGSEEPHA